MQIDLKAGGRIAISQVLPVRAIESQTLGRKTMDPEETAVSEAAQHPVGLEDRRPVDQKINVSGRTEAEIAKDRLREWNPLKDAHCDVAGTKLLDHAPKFGEGPKRLVGAGNRKLLELCKRHLASGRWRFGEAGT
jgi:hypothetical protein